MAVSIVAAPRSLLAAAGVVSATLDGSFILSCIPLLSAVNTGEAFCPSAPAFSGETAVLLSTVVSSDKVPTDSLTSSGFAVFGINGESSLEKPVLCKAARDSINSENPAHGISIACLSSGVSG